MVVGSWTSERSIGFCLSATMSRVPFPRRQTNGRQCRRNGVGPPEPTRHCSCRMPTPFGHALVRRTRASDTAWSEPEERATPAAQVGLGGDTSLAGWSSWPQDFPPRVWPDAGRPAVRGNPRRRAVREEFCRRVTANPRALVVVDHVTRLAQVRCLVPSLLGVLLLVVSGQPFVEAEHVEFEPLCDRYGVRMLRGPAERDRSHGPNVPMRTRVHSACGAMSP